MKPPEQTTVFEAPYRYGSKVVFEPGVYASVRENDHKTLIPASTNANKMPPTLTATKQTTQNGELSSKEAGSPKEASGSRTKSSPPRISLRILTRKTKNNQTSPNGQTNARGSQVKKSPKASSISNSDNKGRSPTSARASRKSAAAPKKSKSNAAKDCAPSSKTLKTPKKSSDLDLLSPLESKRPRKTSEKAAKSAPNRTSPRRITGKSQDDQTSPNGATLSISGRNAGGIEGKSSPKASSRSKRDNKGRSAASTRVSPKSAAAAKKRKFNPAKDCAPSSKTLEIPKTSDLDLILPLEVKRPKKTTEKAAKSASVRTSPRRLTGRSPDGQTSPNGATLSISGINAGEIEGKSSSKASSSSKGDNKVRSSTSTRVSPKSAAAKRKFNPAKDCAPSSKKVKIRRKKEKAQVNNSKSKGELNNEDIEERLLASPKRNTDQSEAFKRYGVIVPSIEEMLAEKNNLVSYRQHVEEAQKIDEPTFVWPSLPKREQFCEPMLDCKSLTLDELTEQFNLNVSFLAGISGGKTYSDRHQRYHNSNQWQHKFTLRDLTYNTSTIVFSFEQVDHLATLIDGGFPDQSKYVFQVLLPELCLKIFMNQHDMSKLQAKKYLDMRPVE
ncbi:hypothetical protein HUJ04_011749 [Dendroctonus ponderosae]|nr:hypothetical protein HUJ04_011749 [Dendroctonus ponderosae]